MATARYYALTTHNAQQSGWFPLAAYGGDPRAVEEQARAIIGPAHRDIYADTEQKNLHVVPSSRLRTFGWKESDLLDRLASINDGE